LGPKDSLGGGNNSDKRSYERRESQGR